MIIHFIHLRNFCQFRDFQHRCSPLLNLILGPNGAGKTNFLNGLFFALAGVDRNTGKLEDNVSEYRQRGEPAFVYVELEHNGQHLAITRTLKPKTAHEVRVDNGDPITGSNAVNAKILEVLGVTKQHLEDYVFIKQRCVDGWLDKLPAERAKDQTALFGLLPAAKAWDAIGKFSSRVTVPAAPVDADRIYTELQVARTELEQGQRRMAAEYGDLPDNVQEASRQWAATLTGRQQFLHASQLIAAATTSLDEVTVSLQAAAGAEAEARGDVQLIEQACARLRPGYDQAMMEKQAWQTYQQSLGTRQQLDADIVTFFQDWAARTHRPRRPDPYVTTDQAWNQRFLPLQRSVMALDMSIEQLQKLATDDACPTCGGPIGNLRDRIRDLCSNRAELAKEFDPLHAQKVASDTYDNAMTTYRAQQKAFTITLLQLRRRQNAMAVLQQPTRTLEQLQVEIDEYDSLVRDLQAAQQRLAAAQAAEQHWNAQVGQKMQLLTTIRQQYGPHAVPEVTLEAAEEARRQQDQIGPRLEGYGRLLGLIRGHEERVSQLQRQLQQNQAASEHRMRVLQALSLLETARTILHHEQAPRDVMRTELEKMTGEINRHMQLFGAPFVVQPDDNLGFRAEFLDGRSKQTDRRLSVGQRIILAMSLLITINSRYVGDLGALAMDEPTAGLDERNLDCLPQALERLREVSCDSGLQVFFVTHEYRLAGYFDTVIQIDHDEIPSD